jgi:CRP/FNR family transcriptional regulator, cyclic AMP receptor protein
MNTAEVIEPTQANFMAREDFLRFLRDHGEAALRVAQQLGETYHQRLQKCEPSASRIPPALSAGPKLKLHRCRRRYKADPAADTRGIAQIIGASRETVTRLFSDFKKKQLVQVKGSTVTIKNKPALESPVGA